MRRDYLYLSMDVSICCQPSIQISSKVSNRAPEPFSPVDVCLVAEYLIGYKLKAFFFFPHVAWAPNNLFSGVTGA